VHVDRHPQQLPGEFERRRVMRDRAGTIAADVEAGPRDEIVEGRLGLDQSTGHTSTQSVYLHLMHASVTTYVI
jgi:hypothetical protein